MSRVSWFSFGDVPVGGRFRFRYGLGLVAAGPVLVKVSPRRYRESGSLGPYFTTGSSTAVETVRA